MDAQEMYSLGELPFDQAIDAAGAALGDSITAAISDPDVAAAMRADPVDAETCVLLLRQITAQPRARATLSHCR